MDIHRALTTLGVPDGASQGEVRKAYRQLSRIKHPDRGGDPKEYAILTEAYTLLIKKGTTAGSRDITVPPVRTVKRTKYTHVNLFDFAPREG